MHPLLLALKAWHRTPAGIGGVTGLSTAIGVDLDAYRVWKQTHELTPQDVVTFKWGRALFRWAAAYVTGVLGGLGLGAATA